MIADCRALRAGLGMILALVLSGAAAPDLPPLPEPPLEGMENAVRERIEEARSELEALLDRPGAEDEELARAYGTLGEVTFTYGLYETARVALENALRLAPERLRWRYFLAVLHADDGRFPEAAELLEELARKPEPYVPALVRLGRLNLSRNRLDQAERWFQRALEEDPGAVAALHGLGMIAAERGNHRRAVETLERVLAAQPSATSVHYPLALALRALGERERARSHLELRGSGAVEIQDPWVDSLASHSAGSGIHMLAGNRATHLGRPAEAAQAFRRAVEAAPENLQARKALGAALARSGRPQEALSVYREVLVRDPDSPASHLNTGMLLARQGQLAEARDHLRRATELAPDYLKAWVNLAGVLSETGDLEDAADAAARAAELAPGDPEVRAQHGLLLARTGRPEEATRELEAALDASGALPPDRDRSVRLELARLLGRQGRYESAARRYAEVLERDPALEEAYFGRAMSLLLAREEAAARETLDEGLERLPESLALRHALARLLATATAAEVRDGDRALTLARQVMRSRATLPHAETVAMALAELGRFDEAVAWQERAIQEARRMGREEALPTLTRRLRRFEAGEPIRAPWGS
ncbi:MAG: tetratricopeptide repeat protein [Thermoanaerobaculia bacterium]|nr:tetratricopeptide repeat protein [Thermoanaerobaculia bacterium]